LIAYKPTDTNGYIETNFVSICSLSHDELGAPISLEPTHKHMRQDVTAYMKHYNQERFHTSNGDMSTVMFEKYQLRVAV